ncbi:DUF2268 domain-containing protein [Bacillus timonensis]|nr:DUF2268 domain-containing protein [Bacillus timonensis]
MAVIRTDRWFEEDKLTLIQVSDKLKKNFKEATLEEIIEYLQLHGMYRNQKDANETMRELKKKNIWNEIERKEKKLQKLWGGPEIPIYILPSDSYNRRIQRDFNGKGGLSFKDKLFLFFSGANSREEMKAVFIHEYNHTCRLRKYKKSESEYNLLDSIILEGLAEHAVKEQLGEDYLADWTKYYNHDQLETYLQKIILLNDQLKRQDKKHNQILYGMGILPKMVGYCVGYYIVNNYLKEHPALSVKDLLGLNSISIAKLEK